METINIYDINSTGIQAQGEIDGITELEIIGGNGKTGDAAITAYWFGPVRVINTNGDPIWEESDPEAFAAMMEEIESPDTMANVETHANDAGETYYSTTDEEGETIYSFSADFEDTWDQDAEDAIDAGTTPSKF